MAGYGPMPSGPPMPYWPRGLSDQLAAAYIGLGITTFRVAMTQAGVGLL